MMDLRPSNLESAIHEAGAPTSHQVIYFLNHATLLHTEVVEIVEDTFIFVLSAEDKHLAVKHRRTMAISCRRHVSFLAAANPPEHLMLAAHLFQFECIDHSAVLVTLNLTLG